MFAKGSIWIGHVRLGLPELWQTAREANTASAIKPSMRPDFFRTRDN
jgi:hypothetical protein